MYIGTLISTTNMCLFRFWWCFVSIPVDPSSTIQQQIISCFVLHQRHTQMFIPPLVPTTSSTSFFSTIQTSKFRHFFSIIQNHQYPSEIDLRSHKISQSSSRSQSFCTIPLKRSGCQCLGHCLRFRIPVCASTARSKSLGSAASSASNATFICSSSSWGWETPGK